MFARARLYSAVPVGVRSRGPLCILRVKISVPSDLENFAQVSFRYKLRSNRWVEAFARAILLQGS